MGTFKLYSLNNFQICYTVLLSTIMVYITSLGLRLLPWLRFSQNTENSAHGPHKPRSVSLWPSLLLLPSPHRT